MLSPEIDLPVGSWPRLSFDAISLDEGGACIAGGDFDAKDVGITVDGGASYTLLNDCTALADGSGNQAYHDFDLTALKTMNEWANVSPYLANIS